MAEGIYKDCSRRRRDWKRYGSQTWDRVGFRGPGTSDGRGHGVL